MAVVDAVEIPFQYLLAAKTGGDLRGKDALTECAPKIGLFLPEQQVGGQRLRQRRVFCRTGQPAQGVAGTGIEIRLGDSQRGARQRIRDMFGGCGVEGNVIARRVVGCQHGQQVLAGSVINARGLEQRAVGRREQRGQDFNGR